LKVETESENSTGFKNQESRRQSNSLFITCKPVTTFSPSYPAVHTFLFVTLVKNLRLSVFIRD